MKCKTCGKNSDNEYCFQHKPRKGLQQSDIKLSLTAKKMVSNKSMIQKKLCKPKNYEDMYKEILKMRNFFIYIWKKRNHHSEVSNAYLGEGPLSIYFHHILSKEKYPEACLDEENVILLTLEEHSNVENDIYKYEEVNKRRNKLKIKYKL